MPAIPCGASPPRSWSVVFSGSPEVPIFPFKPRLLCAAVVLVSCAAGEAPSSSPTLLGNTRCIDGHAVDAALEAVLIRLPDGRAFLVAVASRENSEILRRLEPVAAMRAVIARNRALAERVRLPASD